jgi:hypothetical protein
MLRLVKRNGDGVCRTGAAIQLLSADVAHLPLYLSADGLAKEA